MCSLHTYSGGNPGLQILPHPKSSLPLLPLSLAHDEYASLNTTELYLLTALLSQSLVDRNKSCGLMFFWFFFCFLTVSLMLLSFVLIKTKQIRLSVPD